MKMYTVWLLFIQLFLQVSSQEIAYAEPSPLERWQTLETISATVGRPAENYEVIGSGKQLPFQDTNSYSLDVRELSPLRTQDDNRLRNLLDWLSTTKSDALSQRLVSEPSGRLGERLNTDDSLITSDFRGRRGNRRRGGNRRRDRRNRRKDRRRGRRKGRRNSEFAVSVSSRLRRSNLAQKEEPQRFNEQGVFDGLQPLPFGPAQILQIVPITRVNEGEKESVAREESADVMSLSVAGNSRTMEVVESIGQAENNVSMIEETTGVETTVPVQIIIQNLNTAKDDMGRRKDSNRGRGQEKRGIRRGGRGGRRDKDAREETNIVTVENNNTESNSPDSVAQETEASRRLGRGRGRGGKKNTEDSITMGGDGDRNGRRAGRRGGEGRGRRRGERRGDLPPENQDNPPGSLSNSTNTSIGAASPSRSASLVKKTTTVAKRKQDGRGRRNKRALPKDGFPMLGSFTVPKGKLFKWTRNLGGINSVNEFAFSSTERSVVVVMSFDPKLKSLGFENGATLYDFTGRQGVVALRPRVQASPCYLIETSQTFQEIVAELGERNSTSVATNTVINLDGTGNPISEEEHEAMLQQTPSLRRQCRGRRIVRATPYGMNPVTHSGPTKDIRVLTLDNEVTLTVRGRQLADTNKVTDSSFPGQLFRRWGHLRNAFGRGSGRLAQWIGQGRWGSGQGGSQGRRPQGVHVKGPGNQTTFVTPVPSPSQG